MVLSQARHRTRLNCAAPLLALLWFYSCLSWAAACPPHKLTDPAQVKLQGDSVMIVVHASSTFDSRFATKRGTDEAIRFARDRKIPLVYLQDDSPEQYYFLDDCAPDYWVFSEDGEIKFDVARSSCRHCSADTRAYESPGETSGLAGHQSCASKPARADLKRLLHALGFVRPRSQIEASRITPRGGVNGTK